MTQDELTQGTGWKQIIEADEYKIEKTKKLRPDKLDS